MMTADNVLSNADELETYLTRQKQEIERDIIAQGASEEARNKLRTLVAKLNKNEAAIQAVIEKYVECPRPIDAVMKYLEDTHRAQTKEDIVEGVLRGKFRGGRISQGPGVAASIGVFTSPDATGTKGKGNPLKFKNGLIGLKHWPDEMF